MKRTRRPISRPSEGSSAKLLTESGTKNALRYASRAAFLTSTIDKDLPEEVWDFCKSKVLQP